MEAGQERERSECRVVVGPDEAAAARTAWPNAPLVALVEASDPEQAVYARAAGADVVLPVADLTSGWRSDTPGLAVAVSAATSLAERRAGERESSASSAHDLGQALSAINLAAELANGAASGDDRLLHQIQELARDAGMNAWRAGQAGRSTDSALRPVDLSALLHRVATTESDVAVYDSSGPSWVLADEARLEHLLEELLQHGRHSAASQRVTVTPTPAGTVRITMRAVGAPRSSLQGRSDEFDLVAETEIASQLGARLVVENQVDGHLVVRLTLPLLPYARHRAGLLAVPPDRMSIQADILEGVLRHAPLAESLEAIVAAIEQQLPGTTCSLLLLDDQRCLHHGAGAGLPAAYRDEIDGLAIGFGQGSCGTAAFLGQPVIVSDIETNKHWDEYKHLALQHGLRSCWSTPILAADGGEVLGTFAVYRPETWVPDEVATRLVSRFTYLAAVAIGHHRLFTAVAESESRFRSAFEGASAGMALVGLDGAFMKVNPALCQMLNERPVDLCQANVLDLVEPAYRSQVVQAWKDTLTGADPHEPSEPAPTEVPITGRNGAEDETLWVSLRTSLVDAKDDSEPYFYIELRDITASRRHALERQARQAAEAASQAKTDFLALVSHELRTPLNAILGFAQMMKLVDLDVNQRNDSVHNILAAGQHLLHLINELLDLSLIEAGQFNTRIENVDAHGAVDEVLEILRPLADTRSIRLHGGDPELRGLVVRADRQCLRQVLMNLLGNALKFTPPGAEVDIDATAGPGHRVRILVRDSGPGIAAEAIDDLFEPFHRLPASANPGAEGTGLGLAVAARLAEEMHGTIGVESTVGQGSCFWIELPSAGGGTESTPSSPHDRADDASPAKPLDITAGLNTLDELLAPRA